MGISFIDGKLLILLAPALIFTIWLYNRNIGITTRRDRLILIVRCVLIGLIILSLAGLELIKYSKKTSLVFVVDESSSTGSTEDIKDDFIRKSLYYKTEKFDTGIVTFGRDGFVEYPLSEDIEFKKIETTPQPDFTNIEAGLKLGFALMSPETNKRVVLITDGDQNAGDALSYAKTLSRQGVVIDAVHLPSNAGEDMQISSVELPSMLYEGEEYDIRVVVDSNISASGVPLKLYGDSELIGEQVVDIRKGQNIFLFRHSTDKKGIIGYEAQIDFDDEHLENNSMSGFTYIEGAPLVGIVEGREGSGGEIGKVFGAGAVEYKYIDVRAFPSTLEELRKYSGLILADISTEDLGEERQNLIENFVRDLGRGLIVIGGENSYALGGYQDSTLEKVLPVSMDISNKAHIPSLALMLVIDKSSSMTEGVGGITRLDLAKEAAIRSVETLRPEDTVGVIAFDTLASWVVEPILAEDKQTIIDQIGSLVTGGGTDMYPGLVEAYEALEEIDANRKHIIALSDGESGPGPYDEILEKMTVSNITLSTVAVGEGADRAFLQGIANKGKGRYYFADEFSNIPKIFTKETHIAAQSYVQNRTFRPIASSASPLLSNIDLFPELDGYLATSIKPRANVAVISDDGDPILASWQYGLGKVVAWTSDFEGIWTEQLVGSDEGGRVWLNSLSYILPSSQSKDFDVDAKRSGDRGEITVRLEGDQRSMEGKGIVVSPDGSKQEIDMEAAKPGEYRGSFDIGSQGIYSINVIDREDGAVVGSSDTALAVSYSPEYDIRDRQEIELLERITEETGGRIIDDPADVFRIEEDRVWKKEELAPYLLVFILALFIADIALRRINIGIKDRDKEKGKRDKIHIEKDYAKRDVKGEEDQFTTDLLKARKNRRKI